MEQQKVGKLDEEWMGVGETSAIAHLWAHQIISCIISRTCEHIVSR